MNNLLYARLAKTNLSKNRQNILPYLLSCIGTVVMFFIMDTLAQGSGFDSMIGKDTILTVMGMGTYIIGLFAVIFLIYSNSFLAKRRKKEFGLFQILGMEKKHLAKILFFESLYLWAASLGIGILLGVLLYRLLFLVLMKLTGLNGTIGFAFSAKAVGSTMLLFGLTFVINFLLSLRQIHVSQPVELLHGGAQGEREPKTKLLTAVLGFMLLGVGYYLALTCQSSMDALDKFFNAIALVMVGTYCLFSAGSIAFLKILKKNKNYYYQTRHFTSISGMLYRMKQNAVGLANICILSTGVLLVISISTCLWTGIEEVTYTRFPHQISIEANTGVSGIMKTVEPVSQKMIEEVKTGIDQHLEEKQLRKKYESDQRYYVMLADVDRSTKKGNITCSDCGHEWHSDSGLCDTLEGCTCSQCHAKLKVQDTRKRIYKETQYFSVITICKGYQVIRVAQVRCESRKGEPMQFYCHEVVQRWISPDGKVTDMALLRGFTFYYCDVWALCSAMEIRPHNSLYDDVVARSCAYPKMRVLPQLRRNGFKGDFHGISPVRLFKALLSDPRIETLMKGGEIEVMKHFIFNARTADECWASYLIAKRHKYLIDNFSMWCDYLRMLNKLGQDLRNPKNICPEDFMAAHDNATRKIETIHEKE